MATVSPTTRVAIPGYDIRTETNLDKFSLYTDADNVLIKRKTKSSGTLSPGSLLDHTHGLSYIPFFTTFGKIPDFESGVARWTQINNSYNPFVVPEVITAVDTNDFYINFFGGLIGNIDLSYAFDIFYDDMSTTGNPTITETNPVYKIARPGKSATSTNPNDYIMHSNLNNFKILKQGLSTGVSLTGITGFETYHLTTIAHGADVQEPYKFFCFVKFPDGKTTMASGCIGGALASSKSYDETHNIWATMDGTYLYLPNYSATAYSVDVAWIIYGTGKDNTIDNTGPLLSVASAGHDIRTVTNPDNCNFHSKYNTLKYHNSLFASNTTTVESVTTIAHNLGYVPFFIAFVNDYSGVTDSLFGGNPVYALMPYYEGRSTFFSPNEDIGAYAYADSTNLYLKAYYQANAVGDSRTFNYQYKIFKNNLGL